MKKIPLTQGQFAIVDDHWFDFLNQWKWCAQWDKCTQGFYAARVEGGPIQKTVRMHRVVARTPDGMLCDHIHHNTLDNRESELRNVTRSQSNINRKNNRNSQSRILGVHKRKDRVGYIARLDFQGKIVLNKTFPTMDEAIQARKDAEEKYFGEFAYSGKG